MGAMRPTFTVSAAPAAFVWYVVTMRSICTSPPPATFDVPIPS